MSELEISSQSFTYLDSQVQLLLQILSVDLRLTIQHTLMIWILLDLENGYQLSRH